MEIGLAQTAVVPGNQATNLETALSAIEQAAAAGVDLVVLPELFSIGYFAFDDYEACAESLAGQTLEAIRACADRQDIAVLAGSIVEDLAATRSDLDVFTPAAEGLANTAVLFGADGTRQLVYRKHHLFGYESAEQTLLTPGERLPVTEVGDFTVGVTTCYDLRFPQLYRRLVEADVSLLLVPAAWPPPRVDHWEVLPRARAIENLCYLAAVNLGDADPDPTYVGRSTVYDPWGQQLVEAGQKPTLLTASLDPDRVTTCRSEFPALEDRRF